MKFESMTGTDKSMTYILWPEIEEEKKIIKTLADCCKSTDHSRVLTNLIEVDGVQEDPKKGFALIVKNTV